MRRRREPEHTLAFPSEDASRERAKAQFDIDIEESLRGWFTEMGLSPERVEALARARPSGTSYWPHGKPGSRHRADDELTLTDRQRETLAYMACGYNRSEAAALMGISIETVKQHLSHARYRLRATTVSHMVVLAALIGELDTDIVRDHLVRTWDA